MRGTPFAHSRAMFAAIAAIMGTFSGVAAQQALSNLDPYESRGKGGKKSARSTGTKAFQRAAAKLLNKKARHV